MAGLLCKSIVVTLPAALLLWRWWKEGRVSLTDLLRLLPFFLTGLVITVADVSFYRDRESLSLDYSMVERILIAAHALWFYAGKLLWPVELAVIYPHWDINVMDSLAWGYVIAAIAVIVWFWFLQNRVGRGPLACVLFFALTLSPVLGFVDYGYMQFSFVADRYQYLAGTGMLALFVGATAYGVDKLSGVARKGMRGIALAVLLLLGMVIWKQCGIYKDELTFFNHIVSLNPQARGAHLNLAAEFNKQKRPDEALAAARIAVEKRPNSKDAHHILGLAFLKLEQFDEAEKHYENALQADPHFQEAMNRLAEMWFAQQRYQEALDLYQTLVEIDPDNASTHSNMGAVLFRMGKPEEALGKFEQALSLAPTLETALSNREQVRKSMQQGRR